MNFLQDSMGKGELNNSKNKHLKASITQEFLKISSPNNKIKNINKVNNISVSSDLNKYYINQQKPKNFDINKYLPNYENEENEEEEEINSDEYVSSTNLEVETNTYINMTNSIKNNEEKIMTDLNNKKMFNSIGRIKTKINNNLDDKNQVIGSGVGNIFLNNNEEKFIKYNDNDKELNLYKSNDSNINYYNKIKEDNAQMFDKVHSRKNEFNIESYYKDKQGVFTPGNEGQKTLKFLKETMAKKIDNLHNKNVKNTPQSRTINMLESKSINNFKPINNRLIKKSINLDLLKHQRNKTMKSTINNSISNNVSNDFKNISMNEIYKNINKINSLYNNNNMTKDGININDQKYQVIPQKIKKIKTQGRIGKIIYTKKNDKNNFISFNNSKCNNNINNTINTPLNSNHSKNMKGISPINHSNNMNKYNSICANKQNNNFHSLKNIKTDNVQKNIKKYIFNNDYLAKLQLNQEKNNNNGESNEKQNQQKNNLKPKDSKNTEKIKNQSHKHYQSINNTINNLNLNNYNYEKIVPKNIKGQKQQIRNLNTCLPKRVNQNMINPITNKQILTTISNNPHYNKKLDEFKNDFTSITQIQNPTEYRNTSDNKYKNKELSFNRDHENYMKNVILFKKMRKNKIFKSQDFNNMEINNNNNSKKRKSKPLTTRMNLELMNEDNKNNIKRFNTNTKNSIMNSNNGTLKTTINTSKNNNYAQAKKIYLDKNNFKKIPYKCLSPNYQSIKHLIEDKNNISKIKQMYSSKIGLNDKGRNSYNLYFSTSMNENSNSNYGNNSNNFPYNNNINSNNIILLKKIQKDNLKNRYPIQTSNTVNYNIGNLSNFSGQNKRIIVFNNVNNYNINNTSNALNNITDLQNNSNNKYVLHQTNDDIKHFSSLVNKSMGRNPKKTVINKILTYHPKNNTITGEINNNLDLIGNNIIHLDNPNIKKNNTFMKLNNVNKNQYNKNIIYKYNNINNINPTKFSNNKPINLNDNNQLIQFSISNDKERNTVNNNNSCVNLYLNKGLKKENNTIEIFKKISDNYFKKSNSPNQEIKNKY